MSIKLDIIETGSLVEIHDLAGGQKFHLYGKVRTAYNVNHSSTSDRSNHALDELDKTSNEVICQEVDLITN